MANLDVAVHALEGRRILWRAVGALNQDGRPSKEIYEDVVEEVSPNGKCIKFTKDGPRYFPGWWSVADVEIIDVLRDKGNAE